MKSRKIKLSDLTLKSFTTEIKNDQMKRLNGGGVPKTYFQQGCEDD
ncbi:MAG: pinensin family lanthipeptide [Bacteroidota bacterium]